MASITVSEARAALPEILNRVIGGEEVTLTRHGKPIAVIVRPDTLRVRRADAAFATAEQVRVIIDQARATPLRRRPKVTEERAEALAKGVRTSRSNRK